MLSLYIRHVCYATLVSMNFHVTRLYSLLSICSSRAQLMSRGLERCRILSRGVEYLNMRHIMPHLQAADGVYKVCLKLSKLVCLSSRCV